MKLTPLAKVFIALISLAVIAFALMQNRSKPSDSGSDAPANPPAEGADGASSSQQGSTTGAQEGASAPPASTGRAPALDANASQIVSQVRPVPVVMRRIPGGKFPAGPDKKSASLPTFFIDQTEVTVAQYQAFVAENASARVPPYWGDKAYVSSHADHPISSIPWADADAFCRWTGKRLPTGLEWEHAARGEDGRELPWGNELDRARAQVQKTDKSALKDVAYSLPTLEVSSPTYQQDRSPYEVLGMAGNVAEWTADDLGNGNRAVRGGSWASYNLNEAVVYLVTSTRAEQKAGRLGFRCAADEAAVSALSTASSGGSSASGDDPLARIQASGILRVGAEPGTPPMMIGEPPGPYSGFDFALAQAIATHLGAELKIVPGRYADLPSALQRGDFDLIISGYVPDASISGIRWSTPYLEFGLALMARADGSVKRTAQLAGKRVGVFADPAAERAVRTLIPTAASIETYEEGYLDLLVNNQLDGFYYDFPYAQAEVAAYNAAQGSQKVQIVEYNLTKQSYHVGATAGAEGLIREVNAAIQKLRASSNYKQLIRKYLNKGTMVQEVRSGAKTVTVKAGDSLSSIAKKLYGDVGAWPRIWEANQHRVGNPDLIDIGMVLELP